LSMVLAHQYIDQLDEKVRSAIFGNVGTFIVFRVGAEDAEFLEKEFEPEFYATDLVNLSKYNVYIKLMIDGIASRPFSAATLNPSEKPKDNFVDVIIENNRRRYGAPKEVVDKKIGEEWGSSKEEIIEKSGRRIERSLGILEPKKKERKPVNLEELKEVLSKSTKKEIREEDKEEF